MTRLRIKSQFSCRPSVLIKTSRSRLVIPLPPSASLSAANNARSPEISTCRGYTVLPRRTCNLASVHGLEPVLAYADRPLAGWPCAPYEGRRTYHPVTAMRFALTLAPGAAGTGSTYARLGDLDRGRDERLRRHRGR